jgi:hypothetical protein
MNLRGCVAIVEEGRNAYRVLVWNQEGENPLGKT